METQIEYWVSIGGMTYPAACTDDAGLEALRAAGYVAWKTIDGKRS